MILTDWAKLVPRFTFNSHYFGFIYISADCEKHVTDLLVEEPVSRVGKPMWSLSTPESRGERHVDLSTRSSKYF